VGGTGALGYGQKVTYNVFQNIWVATGGGGSFRIAYSTNAINWTGAPNSATLFTSEGYVVACTGAPVPLWVAGGDGTSTLTYSSDGLHWTTTGLTVFKNITWGVAYNPTQNYWIAAGDNDGILLNTLAYSKDAINWTGLGLTVFNNSGQDVAYSTSQKIWVVAGNT